LEFNRFDVSAKELVWDDPASWLDKFGLSPGAPIEVIDSDITTLSAAADKVIRVGGAQPHLVNIELQSSHETTLARTLWFRQVALDYRHDLPVPTVLVLLRKEANSPSLSGIYERSLPDGRLTNRYDYQVVRLWNEDVESFLSAGVGLVPLAPLTAVSEQELPSVITRMADRINREPRPRAAKLWTATCLLMGLRFPDDLTFSLLEGVQTMQESTTYQKILRDGRAEGLAQGLAAGEILTAQRFILSHGRKRFAEPGVATVAAIKAIQNVVQLEALLERAYDPNVHNWDELLSGA
jgi:predicted transposase YdaD